MYFYFIYQQNMSHIYIKAQQGYKTLIAACLKRERLTKGKKSPEVVGLSRS